MKTLYYVLSISFAICIAGSMLKANELDESVVNVPITAHEAAKKADAAIARQHAGECYRLLIKAHEAIRENADSGMYTASVSVEGYYEATVKLVCNKLIEEGYVVAFADGTYTGGPYISIDWSNK